MQVKAARPIKGIECKFVQFVPEDKMLGRPDMHYVKEVVHYVDGGLEPRLRMIKDYERPFWITKPHLQNHKQKKESEELTKVNMYKSTQSQLPQNVNMRLNRGYRKVNHIRDVASSPYVYGLDIDGRADLKYKYMTKWPGLDSENTVCGFDIETNIDTDEIVIITIAMKGHVYTAMLKSIFPHSIQIEDKLLNLYKKYIPDEEKINYKIKYELFDKPIDMIRSVFNTLHAWKPDFVEIWNMGFDIGKILETLERENVRPEDIFSDPSVPENCRYFYYKTTGKRVTVSGVLKNTSPHEKWDWIVCPASFYFLDGMCVYNYVRTGGTAVPGGYSLDNMLTYVLGSKYKKLKFPGLDKRLEEVEGLETWHKLMLEKYPCEYVVYNQWDVLSMLAIDDTTLDLKVTITALLETASLDVFSSAPKTLYNNLHYFALESGYVMGTRDPKTSEEETLGLGDWIVMLPSHRTNDIDFVSKINNMGLPTNLRTFVFDADAVSSYPSGTVSANISKDTTSRYLLNIEGMDLEDYKIHNINLMFGKVNSVTYAQEMFNFPSLLELLED